MPNQIETVFSKIVEERRSVRGFLPKPLTSDQLKEVFELAQKAPSNCNTQPWQVYVASGKSRDALSQKLSESIMLGKMSMDFDYQGKYEGVYKERQHQAAGELYNAMDIAREDKAKRNEAFFNNFSFFGAPHVAFIFLPEPFGIREAADVGMYAQNLMLSLTAHGFASCPQTALSFDADTVRDVLEVPSHHKLLFGISLGYEDRDSSANRCRVPRAPIDQCVQFVD
jgi:nitroreductase